ncbi:MAG: nitrogen fixation protein NifH [Caldilinea sp. CFX5]|nr:nitrogen fixation protein NifH [Caldilinea sp. CFX5]
MQALTWLLELDPINPGVRYFALRDLLDRPPADAEVRQAQAAIMTTGPVPQILATQAPNGSWGGPQEENGYRSTPWQIMMLADLGADPNDERVQRGCDYLLHTNLAANGAFAALMPRPVPSKAVHCHNGELLYALIRLGRLDDPCVQGALAWQCRAITGVGEVQYYKSGTAGPGFACGVNSGQPCGWGATKALRGLSAIPVERRTEAIQAAIDVGAAFLLSRDPAVADYPYIERVSSSWHKFGFPLSYQSDMLETTAALVDLGYGDDPRLGHALQFILSKQDQQGRWRMERSLNGKMLVDIEAKGQASKWVTLRALRVLKRAGIDCSHS